VNYRYPPGGGRHGGGFGGGPPSYSLEEQLRQLEIENKALREEIAKEAALKLITTVIGKDDKSGMVRFFMNGSIHELFVKDDDLMSRLELGHEIGLTKNLDEIKDVYDKARRLNSGVLAKVLRIVDDEPLRVEIQYAEQVRIVASVVEVEPGDKCLVDVTGFVLIENFGRGEISYALGEEMTVTFDDIGGQEEAIRVLIEAIIEPQKKKKTYERFGMKPCKGVLLWGPPGTGKTMLARALANALSALYGWAALKSAFIYIRGPELLSKWIGETERNIRNIFDQAREHKKAHGYPAIIFIDEADALLGKRSDSSHAFAEIGRTIVTQFASEMDGLKDAGAFVLLATNRPDMLDPSIVRDNRIDRKVHVKRPNEEAARGIVKRLLTNKPCKSPGELAAHATSNLYSDKHHLWDVTTSKEATVPIHLRTLASGAMLAGLVERASQMAIRDESDRLEPKHFDAAILEVENEQRRLSHDLNDFMDALDGTIVDVKKVKAQAEEK
jgi:proteasome ATPase